MGRGLCCREPAVSWRRAIPPDREERAHARLARPQAIFPRDAGPWPRCCRRAGQAQRLSLRRGAENIGRRRPLVVRRRRTRPTLGPAARNLVLLPDARLIGEPDLYAGRIEALVLCNLIQAGGETFLKSSIAP